MKSLEGYVEVHVRISQFWADHPQGRIETDVSFPDENTVRVQARVYRTDSRVEKPAATGHAEERRDLGMVNKTSAVENGETSAVGRALALMGYSIHKGVASREEVEIARRKADAQKNGSQAVSGAEKRPERYADFLRLAIRQRNPKELTDDAEWAKLLASASDKDANARLVKSLEAALVEHGGDPEATRKRYQEMTA